MWMSGARWRTAWVMTVHDLHHRGVVIDLDRGVLAVLLARFVVGQLEGTDVLIGCLQHVVGTVQLTFDLAARADAERHLSHGR